MSAKPRATNNRVVTKNAKLSNKFTQKLSAIPLFGKLLIAVVLLAGITYGGWYGYNTYRANDLKAKAGGWSAHSRWRSNNGVNMAMWACQYRSDKGYPGVKALTIANLTTSYGPIYTLSIGKHSTGQDFGSQLRSVETTSYWKGISAVQLSHSQANTFRLGPGNASGVKLFWSYRISDLAWC